MATRAYDVRINILETILVYSYDRRASVYTCVELASIPCVCVCAGGQHLRLEYIGDHYTIVAHADYSS
jgi:hypothetical protein